MKVVTSQFFGSLYYAAPVWLNAQLKEALCNRLNNIPYRAIRATLCDNKNKIPWVILNINAKRATLKQWARYIVAKTGIKLYNQGNTRIGHVLRQNSYVNDRNPDRETFFGDARNKVGRNCLLNKLHIFNEINFNWIRNISDDILGQKEAIHYLLAVHS